jgi:hypothetical protein
MSVVGHTLTSAHLLPGHCANFAVLAPNSLNWIYLFMYLFIYIYLFIYLLCIGAKTPRSLYKLTTVWKVCISKLTASKQKPYNKKLP